MDGSASIIENKDISCNCYPYDVKLLIRYLVIENIDFFKYNKKKKKLNLKKGQVVQISL